ncbi:MAG TPA: bacitracin ABC transporter permease [Firmicutes bacterium]|nr:bacitracin ABC transporter permease [Bacillota bacterium]
MLNLITCELLKLKHSKMVLLSVLGVLATPCMMLAGALQMHFEYPDKIFTLADIYDNSLVYAMLLINFIVYVTITAYLFSREYTENTLKTLLPILVSRTTFIAGKFLVLFLWIMLLTIVTWAGILALFSVYYLIFGMHSFSLDVAGLWFLKFLLGNILMFFTLSPFAFIAQKTKGLMVPMIASAVVVMSGAALSNQDMGALFPWTATYFLMDGRLKSTGYPISLSIAIILAVTVVGLLATFGYFKKEDIK